MDEGTRQGIKIAYIGGGSRAWAPHLMADLALSPHLAGDISLYDVDAEAARANVQVGASLFSHRDARAHFTVSATDRLEDALRGADFVVISIEPGPITMRYADLEIPRAYGIHQPVGDTTGPGGILRALRAVPMFEGFAHAIIRHCPNAWVINYTNPMTLCVSALYAAEPAIKAFGCCHEVFGVQERLASLVGAWRSVPALPRDEIRLDIVGVNHFTFATSARCSGEDLFPRIREMIAAPGFFSDRTEQAMRCKREEKWFDSDGLISFDFMRAFGVLGAAGDRHLAEFVPWYITDAESLHRWGVVHTPYQWRVQRMQRVSRRDANAALTRSGEEGVAQIHALLGFSPLTTNVNVPNRGQVEGLARGAVVETYAAFERDRITPLVAPRLPRPLASHVRHITEVQQSTLEAAMARDRERAFQALLADPLVRIPTDRAWKMFAEMLEHVKGYLPGWSL
jgi:alpha-galactosidase/6-phospho-beta-glucosidase family protein